MFAPIKTQPMALEAPIVYLLKRPNCNRDIAWYVEWCNAYVWASPLCYWLVRATIESLFSLNDALCDESFNPLHFNNTTLLSQTTGDRICTDDGAAVRLSFERKNTDASPVKHPALNRREGIVIGKTTLSFVQVQSRRISTTENRLPTIRARSCCHLAAIYFHRIAAL